MKNTKLQSLSIQPFIPGQQIEVVLSDRKVDTLGEALLPVMDKRKGA